MKNRLPRTIGGMCAVLCVFCWSGCEPSRPNLVPISGKVTYQGKPVAEGNIVFHPSKGRQAIGAIGSDGTYRLTTFENGDGAMPGTYSVTIMAMQSSGVARPNGIVEEIRGRMETPPAPEWIVPEIYSRPESSPLKAEVKLGQHTIDFNIP